MGSLTAAKVREWADYVWNIRPSNRRILRQELLHQRRVAWIGCVRDAAMNPNVVATAKGRGVGELIGFAAMFEWYTIAHTKPEGRNERNARHNQHSRH